MRILRSYRIKAGGIQKRCRIGRKWAFALVESIVEVVLIIEKSPRACLWVLGRHGCHYLREKHR